MSGFWRESDVSDESDDDTPVTGYHPEKDCVSGRATGTIEPKPQLKAKPRGGDKRSRKTKAEWLSGSWPLRQFDESLPTNKRITRDEDAFLQAASTSGIVEANRQISVENRVEVIGSGSLILPTEEPETISSHEDTSIDGSDDDDDDIRVDCTRLARYVDSYSRHEALRRWAILELVSRSSLGKLLAILRKDYKLQLPKDARTLTKSSSQVSIDGLPLFKSSNTQLWPILIKVEELVDAPVMLVGVFGGQAKPENIEQYLRPLVLEVNDLQQRGLQFGDKQVHFKLRAIVADSPARAYLKAVTSYTGKHGCLKCSCVGEYIKPENKVIFDSVNSAPRTDAGFRAKVDKDHHKSWRTPLEDINNFHLIEDVVFTPRFLKQH
ncbi:uncharacterized protein LOC131270708 [Anopheles coustani]|uniref:uncharacterized protein LOC131270708 n=1 Tax=Anopheles coustani TaxID=139045 RepID=UPI00265B4733|nr:uncharacterized protein LOC131270708 [Anopheles coustani]